MAIIVTPPSDICFSKNRIIWKFEDDREGVIPGIAAENLITFSDNVVAGAQVVIRWGDNELRFTASENPDATGAQFPTWTWDADDQQAYVNSLIDFFQGNYFINEDFVVSAQDFVIEGPLGSVTLWALKLTARVAGSWYNFSKTKFAGGGVDNYVAGTNDSTVVNNSVFIEVWIGDQDSISFKRIHKAALQFDENSEAYVDVAELLHSQLSTEIPDFISGVAMRCKNSRREYYVRYAPAGGTTLTIGKLADSAKKVVVLGGFGEWKASPQSLINTLKAPVGNTDSLLLLRSRTRVIRQDEPVFVSWINFSETLRNVHASVTITFADGTSQTTNTDVVTGVKQYEKLLFAVGFSQLNLTFFNGIKDVQQYTVQLRDDLGPVSEEYRLIVNYAYREYVRYFAFVNSWGAIDTLSTYGKLASSWKVFKESAEKVMPHVYTHTEAQFVEWKHEFQENAEVASGWLTQKDLSVFLDMFISPVKFRVIKGLSYPVAINSDSIERGTDGENLHGVIFEYQFQRRFESLNEQELEGEDDGDYIPANVVLAADLLAIGTAPSDNGGSAAPVRIDPYPVPGSSNAISSNAVYVLLQQKQDKIQWGDAIQYMRGDGTLANFKNAVNAAEKDPTVPSYAKTLSSLNVIFNGLQALNPGLNVNLFGGEMPDWYIKRMKHPEFSDIPPIVVEQGVPFDKFLDLSVYKTSYHQLTDLTVDMKFNALFWEGIEVTKEDGLVLRVKGELPLKFSAETRFIVSVKDQNGNITPLGIRIEVLEEEEPEQPDNRPLCGKGPFHYMKNPIQVINNGKIRAPFDADGVPQLRWKIVNSESDVQALREGVSVNDNGPNFVAEFAPLSGKTYKLGIQGDLCKSPWVYRDLVLPVDNTLNWSEGYPKYNVQETLSEFLAKVDQTGQFLTELINAATNVKLYSQTHDYIADVTEIQIWKAPAWPDGNYRLNVGSLSAAIKVGTPVEPPSYEFKMVSGYDGVLIKDLATGSYKGGSPIAGFNVLFRSNNLGFAYTSYSWKHYVEVNGVYQHVASVGGEASVGSGTATSLAGTLRIFSLNVDSRLVQWNGKSLNSSGKQKTVIQFKNGSAIAGTYEQTIEINELKILGGWVPRKNSSGRISPILSDVQYNGARIIDNAVWLEPWKSSGLGDRRIEFSFDKQTWYRANAWFDNETGNTPKSNLILSNELPGEPVDLFPAGTNKTIYLRNGLDHSVISDAFQINQAGAVALLGTFEATVNGRRITFQKSPGLELTLNADGTITDTTPGTVHGTNGGLTTCNGRNVFYMIGYNYLCGNGDGVRIYKTLKNIKLRDAIETVSRFDCNSGALPSWQAMQDGFSGYPISTGVNKFNAEMSQVTFSLHTLADPGIPLWLVPSRKLNFINYIPNRPKSRRIFAIERINRGDSPAVYWAKDVRTQTQFDNTVSQRFTFRTFKWPWDLQPGMPVFTDSDLYNSLRGHADAWDLGPESVITDEYPENAQNQDPNIGVRVALAYKGLHEWLVENFPNYRKIDGPSFGSYGGPRFYGMIDTSFLYKHPKSVVAEYLGSKVHKAWNVQTATWTTDDCAFYFSDQYKWCNVNVDYYMYFGVAHFNIALDLVFINERIAIGTILKGDECSWMVFGTILSQSLMRNDEGQQIGPEEYRTGDLMQFPNGVVLSKYNTPIAANVSVHWNMGFWATYIGRRGSALWDGGGSYGQDPTKISTYTPADQYIRWFPNSGGSEPYVSGQNGAPENSPEGMADVLYATVVDATMAGHQAALDLEGWDNIKYFASYTSSRKTFVATPGEKGFQLSGNGVANVGLLAMKDVADQKCGTPIISQGPNGRLAVYNNGFLSADEYEENVTLTYGNWTVSIPGRIYGGETKWVKF